MCAEQLRYAEHHKVKTILLTMLQPITLPSFKIGQYELTPLSESFTGNDCIWLFPSLTLEIKTQIESKHTKLRTVNSFLLKTPEGMHLFDTGYKQGISERLKSIGVNPKEINKIFITHMHPTHIGGLMRIGTPLFDNAQLTISKPEYDYWTNKELEELSPDILKDTFKLSKEIFTRYRKRLDLILPMAIHEPFGDGIEPVEAYGHTLGHTAYHITSGDEQLLIIGDLILSPEIQFPYPEVTSCFDINGSKSIRNRKRILNYAADHNVLVAGMHLQDGGVGRITRDPDTDGYIFTPEEYVSTPLTR